MKAKPLVVRPLEAWHETRTSKSKVYLARSDTAWATSNERAAATPRTLWAQKGTDTCKKKLLETLACCSQTPAWARKEVEREFQVTNENKYSRWLRCCDRLIYPSHQGKSDCGWNIIFPDTPSTGAWRGVFHCRETGSELATMSNKPWFALKHCRAFTQDHHEGIPVQEKSQASENMSPTGFLPKENWEKHEV